MQSVILPMLAGGGHGRIQIGTKLSARCDEWKLELQRKTLKLKHW
jgi:hypothetical protein